MRSIQFTILAVAVLVTAAGASPAGDVRLMTEIFPPYQYEEGVDKTLTGISTRVVRAIQGKIGDTSPIKVYPWTRGIKIAKSKKNAALFSTLRTDDRETLFKWVGPLSKMALVFFKKTGSPIRISSIDDARKTGKIGVTKNVANFDVLNSMGFTNLDVIPSGVDEKNIKKLVAGRIDLWPSLKEPGLYNAKKMGYAGQIQPIEEVVIFEGDFYIAFNIRTDDALVAKWQAALDELIKDGTVDAIKKDY